MTGIGILGTGRMGVRLARLFAAAGVPVTLGSRTPERARRIAAALDEPRIAAGGYEDAAKAEWVLPAAFLRDGLLEQLEPLRPLLDGKVYVDISNPFNDDYSDFILPWDTSGAEEIQRRFPRARVVGAFKNVWWEVIDEPLFDGTASDVYVVSDDGDAKRQLLERVRPMPFRFVDAGRLANARIVERMTLFAGELGQREGWFPRMNWRLLGAPWTPGARDPLRALIAR